MISSQQFDGNVSFETDVARTVDLAHPAGTERRGDLIQTETRAGRQGHDNSHHRLPDGRRDLRPSRMSASNLLEPRGPATAPKRERKLVNVIDGLIEASDGNPLVQSVGEDIAVLHENA